MSAEASAKVDASAAVLCVSALNSGSGKIVNRKSKIVNRYRVFTLKSMPHGEKARVFMLGSRSQPANPRVFTLNPVFAEKRSFFKKIIPAFSG